MKDHPTAADWYNLRAWLASHGPADRAVLEYMDEKVRAAPPLRYAFSRPVIYGVTLGTVFVPESVLEDLRDRLDTKVYLDEDHLQLDQRTAEVLERHGLAEKRSRVGWWPTELLRQFWSDYVDGREAAIAKFKSDNEFIGSFTSKAAG
jgi:hypothetical protein